MHRRRAQNIDMWPDPTRQSALNDPPARLDQELPLPPPLVLELFGRPVQLVPYEVIEHDDVRPRGNGLVGLGEGLALDIDEEGEAGDPAHGLHGGRDGA